MALLAMLIIFFSYFYTAIQFDPTRTTTSARTAGSSRASVPGLPRPTT